MTEEKRLACTVRHICYDCQIVPRGAYYRDIQTQLSLNPSFKGTSSLFELI